MRRSARLLEATEKFLAVETRRTKDRLTLPLERALRREIAGIFRQQGRSFLAAFKRLESSFDESGTLSPLPESSRSDGLGWRDGLDRVGESEVAAVSEAPRPRDWEVLWARTAASVSKKLRGILDRAYRAALTAGAKAIARGVPLDISFTLKNPRAVEWLRNRAADRVVRINQETASQLRTLITNAGDKGWSYSRTERAIRAKFAGFSGPPLRGGLREITTRAEMVAVTEIGDAYEAGNRVVADDLKDAGLPMEKSWLTVGDPRVDPICSSNVGDGWIPLDAAFQSGDQQPLAHPGCRCTCEYRVALPKQKSK